MQTAAFAPDRQLAALLLPAVPWQGAPACGRGWATRRRRVPPPPAHTPPPATAGPGPCRQSCVQSRDVWACRWATAVSHRITSHAATAGQGFAANPAFSMQAWSSQAGVEQGEHGQGAQRWLAGLAHSGAATEAAPPLTNVCKPRSPQQRDSPGRHLALERHSQPALKMCGGLGWGVWAGLHAVEANRRKELLRHSGATGENSKHRRWFAVPRCLPSAAAFSACAAHLMRRK